MNEQTMQTQAEKFRDQAWTLRGKRDYAQALIAYESALVLHAGLNNPVKQVELLMEMGDTALHGGDTVAARRFHERGQALLRGEPTSYLHDRLLNGLKTISLAEKNFAQAHEELLQIMALRGERDARGRAVTLRELGEVTAQLGRAAESDAYFEQAYRLAEPETNLARSIASGILWQWGVAHYQRGQREESYRLCRMAFLHFMGLTEAPQEARYDTALSNDMGLKRLQRGFDRCRKEFIDMYGEDPMSRQMR